MVDLEVIDARFSRIIRFLIWITLHTGINANLNTRHTYIDYLNSLNACMPAL